MIATAALRCRAPSYRTWSRSVSVCGCGALSDRAAFGSVWVSGWGSMCPALVVDGGCACVAQPSVVGKNKPMNHLNDLQTRTYTREEDEARGQ